ncbi:SDR family NAD(P)-dependent oxidoreductase [Variovorax boronicumulans]|uniref:SDR family NAD(P)-dependent oxidoreductase n=1 Tax=Variovorax boronicumulans TaxID=436515 RepID=UPI0012E6422A|nr:glucose 1-dehydrogenase [Variovorax boronicumulans]MDP9913069.1 2-deoxy-D-gluconate 3-dehydrogenase [Variovorax boronicumulans]GER21000.1 2-deoxy-D-gluconate 3-dehydrogenase [Variovorax boronicumulans]
MFDLTGKVALVTGGNGGIGLGMAQGLAKAGARVIIAARNAQKSAAAVESLKALGSDSFALALDVTDEASVQKAFDEVAARCGRLDILVNNAGTTVRKPVDQLALAEWHQVMDTNLTSAFLCSRAAHPHLKAAGGGKIINIGSMMSIFGAPYAPAYAASKAGIVQLTKSTALSWAVDQIQVNAILPGWFETELTDGARTQIPGLYERVKARAAAGRWGQPSDIAGTAVFLASAASDYVTGTAIPVDGGFSISG